MPERNVLPKPYVKPHPPMWVAAGNPDTFEKAGKLGLGVLCFTGGSPEKMKPLIEIYKETIEDAEPVGDYVNDNVAIATSFMCLEDGDARPRLDDQVTQRPPAEPGVQVPRHLPQAPGHPRLAHRDPRPDARAARHRLREGHVHRRHARRVRRGARRSGTTSASTSSSWARPAAPTPTSSSRRRSSCSATKVIPQFDTDPEPRSARHRREAGERLGVNGLIQAPDDQPGSSTPVSAALAATASGKTFLIR